MRRLISMFAMAAFAAAFYLPAGAGASDLSVIPATTKCVKTAGMLGSKDPKTGSALKYARIARADTIDESTGEFTNVTFLVKVKRQFVNTFRVSARIQLTGTDGTRQVRTAHLLPLVRSRTVPGTYAGSYPLSHQGAGLLLILHRKICKG